MVRPGMGNLKGVQAKMLDIVLTQTLSQHLHTQCTILADSSGAAETIFFNLFYIIHVGGSPCLWYSIFSSHGFWTALIYVILSPSLMQKWKELLSQKFGGKTAQQSELNQTTDISKTGHVSISKFFDFIIS